MNDQEHRETAGTREADVRAGCTAEDLLEGVRTQPGEAWVVLQTRARCEKKIAGLCATQGIHVYLPVRAKAHRYGARERTFTSPLFPGYVFALADGDGCRRLTEQREVARLLRVSDQAQLLHQLRQIRDALRACDMPEVMPYIEEGRLVRITAGSLKGVEGIVQRWQGKTRVVLNVEMIGQAVALEVEPHCLDPVL